MHRYLEANFEITNFFFFFFLSFPNTHIWHSLVFQYGSKESGQYRVPTTRVKSEGKKVQWRASPAASQERMYQASNFLNSCTQFHEDHEMWKRLIHHDLQVIIVVLIILFLFFFLIIWDVVNIRKFQLRNKIFISFNVTVFVLVSCCHYLRLLYHLFH